MADKQEKHTQKSETAEREEKVLSLWKERNIFEKTLAQDSPKGEFVFYDGPPFATGLPHYGSLLSSIVKDVIPRYKTMQGFHVRRRWGWDCHGLPIENMIEKELGLKSKKDIEEMGIEQFNETCRASVLRYADEWEKYVNRIGRWVDYDNSYKTMDVSYMESVWWALKRIYKKGLLYEGRKVLLYCPRCETPLAKAEVAMDNSYKEVTEDAVTVKFKVKNPERHNLPENTYLLAWTTTPWTLPGNVALAVGDGIGYVVITDGKGGYVIMAAARAPQDTKPYKVMSGSELVGIEYEPLYEIDAVKKSEKKSWYVTDADFVTTEEGTGIVHTAVIYGEDDYSLGLDRDLPMIPLLNANGHFNVQAPEFIQKAYFKKAEKNIIKDLTERKLLFKVEKHTHSYPHCHRCDTALFYNAISSWFINIQKVKKRLLRLNKKVNWFPEHLKHGRFQHIVETAPDWTISRNRYWASPLPIWKCESCQDIHVLGSVEELKKHGKKSGNTYLVMRHAEAENNVKGLVDSAKDSTSHLTEQGKHDAQSVARELRTRGIDSIIASPVTRARETAELIAKELGIQVTFDDRIAEISMGVFEGKSWDEYHTTIASMIDRYHNAPEGGESYFDVKRRVGEFLYEIERTYQGKNILIVSHGSPISQMHAVASAADVSLGAQIATEIEKPGKRFFKMAEVRELQFVPLPHNRDYELDLHRPYIDAITLTCSCGGNMNRIPEVVDGWVESASMPFAEYHYPFENKKTFKKRFPGDFIAEYIAQTRTWFYYMHAIAGTLFKKPSFKNVITTGTILAEDGSKMSKSKGNYTDPLANLTTYGADALRYYLMASVVMVAEDLRFTDDDLREVHNRLFNILWNVFKFYDMYADEHDTEVSADDSTNVLDLWIRARLSQLTTEVTEGLEAFNTVQAARPIRDFVTDLSTWYIRRSRDRFRGDDEKDKQAALATTRYVLLELSKLMAPFTPFIAEDIYQRVGGTKESVHLEEWPQKDKIDTSILAKMEEVREIVSQALESRATAGIKVRQPLAQLTVRRPESSLKDNDDMVALIRDELNVKKVVFEGGTGWEVELDTTITPELKAEGQLRDFIRAVQSLRKSAGVAPQDMVQLHVQTDDSGKAFVERFEDELRSATSLGDILFQQVEAGEEVHLDDLSFTIGIEKAN